MTCQLPPDLLAFADQRAARAAETLAALVRNEADRGRGPVGDAVGVAVLTEIVSGFFGDDERAMAETLALAIRTLAAQ